MLSIVLAGLVFSPFAGQSGIATYASIRGQVTTGWPYYKPVANAQVVASGDVDWRQTRTDANGRYTILTLLPGIYHVYVPSVKGLVMFVGSRETMVRNGVSGSQAYVAANTARVRQCFEKANAPVELSAGLAYFANIDLTTHCT